MSARWSRTVYPALQTCGAVLFLTMAANATDYYVDAVNGNNAFDGTSPASAWRTITHALSTLPVPSGGVQHTVHVAPGTYNAGIGEQFPLFLMGHDAIDIVGDAGPQVTILDGGGAGTLIIDMPSPPTLQFPWNTGPLTRVRGLTLQNADTGIFVAAANSKSTDLTCTDLIIQRMRTRAVEAKTIRSGFQALNLTVKFERVLVRGCRDGFLVRTDSWDSGSGPAGHANVQLVDCTINDCAGDGIFVADTALDSRGSNLTLLRSRITGNERAGLRIERANAFYGRVTTVDVQDCLFARNVAAGVKVYVIGETHGSVLTSLQRCTIVDNLKYGVDSFVQPPMFPPMAIETTLSASILYGNEDDVLDNPAWPTVLNPAFNDIGDGDYAGSNGNIALDPQFRDAPNGDWRLAWGSPCVDVGGSMSFKPNAIDLAGANRNIDGDLDTLRQNDMGAFEFAPLWPVGAPHLGQPFALEQWGPAGSSAMLLAVRGKGLATPVSTPFGDLFVHVPYSRNLGSTPAAPGPPALRVLTIPANPIYIGQVVTFQALTTSVAGSAYTNASTVTIVP